MSPYKTTGKYIQDQISIADRLKLIVGLRHEHYSSETIDGQNRFHATQNALLPRFGLTYGINKQINYFASYSQGFVPVGANFIQNYKDYGADKPFEAERSFQIETGLKTGFLKISCKWIFPCFRSSVEICLLQQEQSMTRDCRSIDNLEKHCHEEWSWMFAGS
ncbi:TonB-dependent receptor [Sphingobacterium sp. E70]|uniref:TonB-dependent receptor domain-containing protein n=1 Tax=Sphingobacterium sp. E70 TaxID=2853439 RepID=UPI00211BA2ED|nr:TonB-dependent receptor [Sphingobacterium sp. E70]ULT23933.1 TonB-dependent receptor [Sphingobacterium sp. E70]